jgi:pseudouridine-5'-phosphate glycosidase
LSGGRTLQVNLALLKANAHLAGQIAQLLTEV